MTNYEARWRKLQEKMAESRIGGFLLTQNVDIYYFTGTMQAGYLFVPGEGDPVFYVKRSLQRAEEESAATVEDLGSFGRLGERLTGRFPESFAAANARIASEFDVLPVQVYLKLRQMLPDVEWVDGSRIVREIRMFKSPEEIEKIKAAARIADKALEYALSQLKPGMEEVEWISHFEASIRKDGHSGMMRMRGYNLEMVTGMIGAGDAAARPTYFDGPAGGFGLSPAFPQGASRRKIGINEPILIDVGCCVDGYVIDQTRTAVIGELNDELMRAYEKTEEILRETEKRMKPGTLCEDLYLSSLEQAEACGLGRHFMGYGADRVKFLGHGIGLEVDELPVLARGFAFPLEPGMVIAVEPKFTFPDKGVVGIENTYAITESGCEKLCVTREGLIRIPV